MRNRTMLALALLAASGGAAADPDGLYRVSVSLSRDGQQVDVPTLLVRPGAAATIETAAPEPITISVQVFEDDHARPRARLSLGGDAMTGAPTIVAAIGERASARAGRLELAFVVDREP